MSEQLETIVDTLSKLTVLDLSNLKNLLEEKWDVKASAGAVAMAMPAGGADAGAAAAEESTEFDITLKSTDASKKIAAIKAVRETTGLGLKEAKELVESAPSEIKKGASKAESEEIKAKLEAAACVVEVKGV